MERTRKVELRGRCVLVFALILCLCGCNTINDGKEYQTKIKVEATAGNEEQEIAYSTSVPATESMADTAYPINLNQVGYRTKDRKIAVVNNNTGVKKYQVIDGSGNTVYKGIFTAQKWDRASNGLVQYADFSMFTEPGSYFLVCGDELYSDEFTIGNQVYNDYYDAIGTYFSDDLEQTMQYGEEENPNGIMAQVYGKEDTIDVSGGWYDLANRGQYIVDSTNTIASLLLLYDSYQNEELNKSEKKSLQADSLLELVKQELTWLMKIQNSQGGVYHKVTISDDKDSNQKLMLSPVSTCATADFAAVMAKAYRYYEKKDWDFANECLAAAQRAWNYLENNPGSAAFSNPEGITTSEFTDDDDRDERFWAAVELSLTTKRSDYATYVAENIDTGFYIGFTWQKVAGFAIMDGLVRGEEILSTTTYKRMQTLMKTKLDSIQTCVDTTIYQIDFNSDVNFQTIISEGITLYLMSKHDTSSELCTNAKVYLDYLMGANPYSENYIGDPQRISDLDMDYVAKLALLLVGVNEFH